MNILTKLSDWQASRKKINGSIGFVPTMGHLHAGHRSLFERARQENDFVVVSIFINPTQFNAQHDFIQYPKTIAADCALLESAQVDYVLIPDAKEIYQDEYTIKITESDLSLCLEGEYRPGHFDGVLTVLMKLFNLLQPMNAYFGEKDYQQYLIVKKMVAALFMPINIISCETKRTDTGLALSSRNTRLSDHQIKKAAKLHEVLTSKQTLSEMKAALLDAGFNIDYVAEKWGRRLAAVWLDETRLIDNVEV